MTMRKFVKLSVLAVGLAAATSAGVAIAVAFRSPHSGLLSTDWPRQRPLQRSRGGRVVGGWRPTISRTSKDSLRST